MCRDCGVNKHSGDFYATKKQQCKYCLFVLSSSEMYIATSFFVFLIECAFCLQYCLHTCKSVGTKFFSPTIIFCFKYIFVYVVFTQNNLEEKITCEQTYECVTFRDEENQDTTTEVNNEIQGTTEGQLNNVKQNMILLNI